MEHCLPPKLPKQTAEINEVIYPNQHNIQPNPWVGSASMTQNVTMCSLVNTVRDQKTIFFSLLIREQTPKKNTVALAATKIRTQSTNSDLRNTQETI